MGKTGEAFEKLVQTVDELRVHCPWDRKQTIASLRSLTLEEVYELAEAIDNEDYEEIKKELGDVLLHVVFYAKIATEKQEFDIAKVCEAIVDKLVKRHPHVYGDVEADTEEKVKANWEKLKKDEKSGKKKFLLDGIPKGLPPLIKAMRIQDKAAATGFDWENDDQVWEKVREEMNEFEKNINDNASVAEKEDELGDLFFSLINFARFKGLDAEKSLESTNRKFMERFRWMEEKAGENNKSLKEMNINEMEELWQQSKIEKKSNK